MAGIRGRSQCTLPVAVCVVKRCKPWVEWGHQPMGIRARPFNPGTPILEMNPAKKFKNGENALQGKNAFVAVEIRTVKDQKQYKCLHCGVFDLLLKHKHEAPTDYKCQKSSRPTAPLRGEEAVPESRSDFRGVCPAGTRQGPASGPPGSPASSPPFQNPKGGSCLILTMSLHLGGTQAGHSVPRLWELNVPLRGPVRRSLHLQGGPSSAGGSTRHLGGELLGHFPRCH